MGFISGLNYGYNDSKNGDTEGIYFAVLNYCKKNPLKLMVNGAVYVYHNKL